MRTICLFFSMIVTAGCASNPPPASASPASQASSNAQTSPSAPTSSQPVAFNRAAAAAGLGQAARDIMRCLTPTDPHEMGHIQVTFTNDGHVTNANIDMPPYDTAPSKKCIEDIFAHVSVPAFDGTSVKVGKSFDLGNASAVKL